MSFLPTAGSNSTQVPDQVLLGLGQIWGFQEVVGWSPSLQDYALVPGGCLSVLHFLVVQMVLPSEPLGTEEATWQLQVPFVCSRSFIHTLPSDGLHSLIK